MSVPDSLVLTHAEGDNAQATGSTVGIEEQTIVFQTPQGKLTLSFKDGSVKIEGFTPEVAAMEFWRLVTECFPIVKDAIKAS